MYFKQLSDKKLSQYAYLIGCQKTGEAIVIDPMRDIDQYYKLAEEENLAITAAVDTHIHADYVSGLGEFAENDVKIYASDEGGEDWKYLWLKNRNYNYHLIKDGDTFTIGQIKFDALHTPGHTPESVSFLVTDSAATEEPMGLLSGDFVFVGDAGRPDLLETVAGEKGAMRPAAQSLYQSIQQFKTLPEYLQLWPAHGSGSACGKAMGAVPESTVGYEQRFSPAMHAAENETQFIDYILDGQPEPPLYFSRMKTINKKGAPVLGTLPKPIHVSIGQIINSEGVILDTRDKKYFMKRHLPGSLLASFDNNFNTIAGSYVEPGDDIYLVIDKSNLEQAVRDLIHVGLDNIKAYATPDDLDQWEGEVEAIEAVNFDDVKQFYRDENTQVLDVRKASEFNSGHIPDAKNIAHARLAAHLKELPKDKQLFVHCASGQRASYASGLLAKEGFNIKWVNDAFSNWDEEE